MKRRMGVIVMALVVWAAFMVENAVAQIDCKPVNVHMRDYWEYAGSDACGQKDWCGEARLIGTINGLFFASGMDSDLDFPSFGDSHVWKGQYTIETKQGDIFTTAVGIQSWETFFFAGVGTNQESHVVTGGTGRYEGATGYLLLNYVFFPPDFFPGTGEMSGQVCWPQE